MNLDEFFRYENHEYPPLLSNGGGIHKLTLKAKYEASSVDDCIIDVAVLIQMNNPRMSKTFREYCGIEISEKVERITNTMERVDIVFGIFRKAPRKLETSEGRGKNKGVRISIKKNTPVYRKFNQVLEVSENKTELSSLIADTLVENFQHK